MIGGSFWQKLNDVVPPPGLFDVHIQYPVAELVESSPRHVLFGALHSTVLPSLHVAQALAA